ncbi:hypothetical protein DCS_00084 [Drechmeria coniospora]|uniref:Secreted protein n=1 Tax=Drechmeria coniospora TaxID=98403 RepID=A0A151GPC6_DRECN|nr:hypothetical protein DCS_00084 [Drechmeria coniospora]KYK58957.1 hypothetical protein DCS_00084 [Drechmeria coniospora]
MRTSIAPVYFAVMATGAIAMEPPIPGYGVETLEWNIEVSPGKTEVLNGTVQDVYAQALQINPDFKLQINPNIAHAPEARALKHKRTAVNCGNWPLANKGSIQDGIGYLRGLGAAPRNGPGPGNCGRNSSPKTLDNWDWIADSAQHIVNTCAPVASWVSGQNFESGNWNSIVRGDSC